MKYIKRNNDGTASVGTVKADWGEFEFTETHGFKDFDDALQHIYDTTPFGCKIQFRVIREVSIVPVGYLDDLCAKADRARAHRDEEAAEAGIKVHCRSTYEGHHNPDLECYNSDFGEAFVYEGETNAVTPACRRFWAEQNYLVGLADGVWELGFTLCFNTKTGKHEVKGNRPKLVIEADGNSEI